MPRYVARSIMNRPRGVDGSPVLWAIVDTSFSPARFAQKDGVALEFKTQEEAEDTATAMNAQKK